MRPLALTLVFSLFAGGVFAAQKPVELVCRGGVSHRVGDGFKAINYFPNGNLLNVSPFVLLDYMSPSYFPPSETVKGVGAHPHRGFETVTFVYEGEIAHRDSHGGGGVIGPGDVQWMTAGSGVLHQEYHSEEFTKKGGTLHGIQLWVNLPTSYKMTAPRYQALKNEAIPRTVLDDKGSYLRTIAGSYQGLQGAAKTFSPIEVYDVSLKAGTSFEVNLPSSYNTFLLVADGSIVINKTQMATTKNLVVFSRQGETFVVKAVTDAILLVFSGEPLGQPVIQSGPFVMNTEQEIAEAYQDFEEGKFGVMN